MKAFNSMKLRVKTKAGKNLNVALSEADEKILHMFGNGWFEENFKNQKESQEDTNQNQNSSELPILASDDDLQVYLDDPYEIEEVTDDNFQSQSSQDSSSREHTLSGMSTFGSILGGQSSRGQSSRGQSSRGRGQLSLGLSTRGKSFRGQPQRGTINGPKIRVS